MASRGVSSFMMPLLLGSTPGMHLPSATGRDLQVPGQPSLGQISNPDDH